MKLALVGLLLSSLSLSASADSEGDYETISQIHRRICAVAVEEYPKAMRTIKDCVQNTDLELNPKDYSISFTSCETGEWVTVFYDRKTKEILVGSSGLEDDMCEGK